jgi:ABC-type nitrate/sulfonate/bicarbonate transport system substrate-binding protein
MMLFDAIYPDIGYLIVNKDSSYSSMHNLLTSGRPKIIAVGLPGSGGANTLQYLLASHQNWHDGVSSTQPLGGDEALTALVNHQVDAYFVMEPPVSKFITDNVNSGQYAGKFKLIGINPYDSFFDTKDGKGRTMYQSAKLPGGSWWSGSTPTISVDVVLIMNRGFVNGNEEAAHLFVKAVRQAAPIIRRDAGADPAWQPATRLR